MSRYIDADKIKDELLARDAEIGKPKDLKMLIKSSGIFEALIHIQLAPAEDVAPVVRCKDCVYGEIDDPDFPNQYLCHYYGNIWNDGVHFCSNGEIRNDR